MVDTTAAAVARPPARFRRILQRAWDVLAMPLLAIFTAFLVGGVVIWLTSGQLSAVFEAYGGLIRGAFFKQRGFSETLVAMTPYVFLSLGLAVVSRAAYSTSVWKGNSTSARSPRPSSARRRTGCPLSFICRWLWQPARSAARCGARSPVI